MLPFGTLVILAIDMNLNSRTLATIISGVSLADSPYSIAAILQTTAGGGASVTILVSVFAVVVAGFTAILNYANGRRHNELLLKLGKQQHELQSQMGKQQLELQALLGRQQHELQSLRNREEWFRSFRALQADFWSIDEEISHARRMIANQPDYLVLREILLRRNPSYASSDIAFDEERKRGCDVSPSEYRTLDALDRLLALLVRMDDARDAVTSEEQRRAWDLMHCDYWLKLIRGGRRPELLLYCKECWPDLAKATSKEIAISVASSSTEIETAERAGEQRQGARTG